MASPIGNLSSDEWRRQILDAAENGKVRKLAAALQSGQMVKDIAELALVRAAEWGKIGAVALLVLHQDPAKSCDDALVAAAEQGHLLVVQLLLQKTRCTLQAIQDGLEGAKINKHEIVIHFLSALLAQVVGDSKGVGNDGQSRVDGSS